MTKDEMDRAHDLYEMFSQLIVVTGVTLLKNLTPAQQEYVIVKLGGEFRFWNIEEALTDVCEDGTYFRRDYFEPYCKPKRKYTKRSKYWAKRKKVAKKKTRKSK